MTFLRAKTNKNNPVSFKDYPSMTEQAHKDDVDIHVIMKKFKQTGIITHVNAAQGTYMDYSNNLDYHEAQNIIADAKSLFETVPAHIRKDFQNDPQQFINFMQDPTKTKEIEAYGLDASHLSKDPDKASDTTSQANTPPPAPAEPETIETPPPAS